MYKYRIFNSKTGADLGEYRGRTEDEAMDRVPGDDLSIERIRSIQELKSETRSAFPVGDPGRIDQYETELMRVYELYRDNLLTWPEAVQMIKITRLCYERI